MKQSNTKKLTFSAIMVALATVLSFISVYRLANGGSVTLASMVPIILVSYLYDVKWSVITSLVYAALQMMMGFYPPPTNDVLSYFLVVMLDYVIAFGCLGLAGVFFKILGKTKTAVAVSGAIVVFIRFVCHFLSGIIIWDVWAPEGQSVYCYSLTYNGSYMGLELVITVAVMALMSKFILEYRNKIM